MQAEYNSLSETFDKEYYIIKGNNINWYNKKSYSGNVTFLRKNVFSLSENNYMIKEIIESLQADLNVILIFDYKGGEPQTVELDIFLTNISKYDFHAIIGVGGGSTLDFTKAASVLHKRDVIVDSSIYQGVDFEITAKVTCVCIPTTAGSGAEATKSAVMFNPKTNVKRGINNLKILPDIVFLVPAILDNLPGKVFYPSLFDGVTHAFESLIGNSSTKETSLLAKKSLNLNFQFYQCSNL